MSVLSAGIYLMATTLLLPGTLLLLPSTVCVGHETNAISILICATALLTFAAMYDLRSAVNQDARAFAGPVCMLIGGISFLAGAVLYWPAYGSVELLRGWTVSRVGTWVFRVGTMAYLAGSGVSLRQMVPAWGAGSNTTAEDCSFAGVLSYTLGAVLYLVGGCISEAGSGVTGSWLWIVGSGWFCGGSLLLLLGAASAPPRPEQESSLSSTLMDSSIRRGPASAG